MISKWWHRITGKCLKEAQKDLHDSSQWSREEMTKLLAQAKLNREREEEAMRAFEAATRSLMEVGNDKRTDRSGK